MTELAVPAPADIRPAAEAREREVSRFLTPVRSHILASDGMLKLGASKGQEVRWIIDFVFGEDMDNVPIEELERKLQEKYQQRKIAGLLDEYDDTTLAVISSIPPGTDFLVFESGFSNIKTVSPQTEEIVSDDVPSGTVVAAERE